MKNWKFVCMAAALAAAMPVLTSCDDDDDDDYTGRVPQAVEAAFASQYPGASFVEWDMEGGGYYVAEFYKDGREHDAWYTAAGAWAMTEVDYARNLAALPQAVQQGYAASAYGLGGWVVDDIDEIQRPGYETIYIMDVEKAGQPDRDLYFDLGGTLFRDVQDGQAATPGGPTGQGSMPEQIRHYVDSVYAGASIVDFDREQGGYYEVDLRHGGKSVEVTFTDAFVWVRTKTDLTRSVPDVVRTAIAALYPGARIDDCDFVETPSGSFYAVETDRPDADFRVEADGTVTQVK